MNDPFKIGLYPHAGKIKSHFRDIYDSVFIAYLPFFKLPNTDRSIQIFTGSEAVSLEEAQKRDELFKKLDPSAKRTIYMPNRDYPSQEMIRSSAEAVEWQKIIREAGFKNSAEVNAALKTSIGAYKESYARPDLAKRLLEFTSLERIWHPIEGQFGPLSAMKMHRALTALGKREIQIQNEHQKIEKTLLLDEVDKPGFSEKVTSTDCFIFSADKEVLFAIDWDDFFFLAATTAHQMKTILSLNLFEGFACDEETEQSWELGKL